MERHYRVRIRDLTEPHVFALRVNARRDRVADPDADGHPAEFPQAAVRAANGRTPGAATVRVTERG